MISAEFRLFMERSLRIMGIVDTSINAQQRCEAKGPNRQGNLLDVFLPMSDRHEACSSDSKPPGEI
jgi:hypothetical protein